MAIVKKNGEVITPGIGKWQDYIAKTIQIFKEKNEIFEIRILPTKNHGVLSGFFINNYEGLKKMTNVLKRYVNESIYMTLNQINKDCISDDRIGTLENAGSTTKDAEISNFKYLHVDFDPVRQSHTQATEKEKELAKQKMILVKNNLSESGFSEPIISFSGNGYNLDYAMNIPNTKENSNLLKAMLKCLSDEFSNEAVDIDRTTYNASRIIKLFGCKSCKGENTPERPYRYSKIIKVPDNLCTTDITVLKKYVSEHSDKESSSALISKHEGTLSVADISFSSNKDKKTIPIRDVKKWLDSYNISYTEQDYDGKDMYVLDVCPFNEEHTGGSSFLLVFDDKQTFFKCHHNHCSYKSIHDFVKLYPVNQPPVMDGTKECIILYNAVLDCCTLVRNIEDNASYVKYKDKLYPLGSEDFSQIMLRIGQEYNLLPGSKQVATIKENFNALYSEYAEKNIVGNRIIIKNNCLLYALSEKKIISINNGKLGYYTGNKVLFYHNSDMKEQISPDISSPAEVLPDLIKSVFNIKEDYLLRFIAQLLCFYIPNINTPILLLSGSHGTSKTTTARKIKSLVDPSTVDVVSLPDKEDGLCTTLSNNYLTVFDNAEKLTKRYSDLLAIACTGGYSSRRKLYTDNDMVQIPLHSKIVITGIGDIVNMPDLAERCNPVYLDVVAERKTESQVWAEFNELKPQILGSIFNTIRLGLSSLDKFANLTNLPRMADFTQYGASFIHAMGLDYQQFISEYTQSNAQIVQECDEQDSFISLLKAFLESIPKGEWSGTSSKLLNDLRNYSVESNYRFNDTFSASSLSRRIKQERFALESLGICFERHKSQKREIILSLKDNSENSLIQQNMKKNIEGSDLPFEEQVELDMKGF